MIRLARYFVNNSFLVNLITALIIAVGTLSLFSVKKGLAPPWERKQILIRANIDGASPSQVEEFLTFPIEQNIRDLSGIKRITSDSGQGWARIYVHLEDGLTDIRGLEQEIKDKITILRADLPKSVEDVVVRYRKDSDKWFSSYSILGFNENDDSHQNWLIDLKQRLRRINGLNRIYTSNNTKQIFVKLDNKKLSRYQISITDVQSKIREAFSIYPVGSVDKGSEEFLVEIKGKQLEAEDVGNIVIRATNSTDAIYLKNLGLVEKKLKTKEFYWFVNGQKTVELTLFSSLDTDMLILKNEVAKFFEVENERIPKGIELVITGDGPAFLERQIDALKTNSLFGLVLVCMVLLFFLGWKNAIMTTIGLPLCYGFTFTVLHFAGIKVDLISIVGMLLVLGILVDDAIIIAEQYSQNLEKGDSPSDAAVNAVKQMWMPVFGATLTTIAAFFPLLIGTDPGSKMMIGIPIVIIGALCISLFECFFILPNHLAHVVKEPKKSKFDFNVYFKYQFSKILNFFLKWRYPFVVIFASFMGYSIYFAQQNIPMNFNLNISNERISIKAVLKNTKSLQDSREQLKILDNALARLDKSQFSHYESRIGKIWQYGEEKIGPEYNYFGVIFAQRDPLLNEHKDKIEKELRSMLPELKKSGLFKTLEIRRNFQGRDTDKTDQIEINIESYKPFEYYALSQQIIDKMKELKGVTAIDNENSSLIESWQFTPNYKKILQYGLSLSDLSLQLRSMVAKHRTYEYKTTGQVLNIYTYTEEGKKQTYQGLQNKTIILGNGKVVALKELGEWKKVKKYKKISHANLKRKISMDIPFDKNLVKKENLIKEIKQNLKEISNHWPGIKMTVQDADEQSRENKKSISSKLLYAIIAIFFILAVILRSLIQPILICLAIPFGVIGVIWAFHLQGLTINMMAIIGIIGMAGVVVNDSLIMVNTINLLKRNEKSFTTKIIIEGATSRLRPIILTSLTTLGGVFPMAYAIGGDAGFTKMMAMSMGWGILFATALTLFLLPCFIKIQGDLLNLFSRFKSLKKIKNASAAIKEIERPALVSQKAKRQDEKSLH